MIKKIFLKYQFWILIFLFTLGIFNRFYSLEKTATFFWDQAYDLRQIELFYQEKRITLIGPISEENDKIYGSLTYYMLMPFALLKNFHTVSTTYGSAFYGSLTAIFLVLLLYLINKKTWLSTALIAVIWFPLIETSRWAWNPHLVLFWIALGLIFFQKKSKASLFLSGLFLGLSIHHHYLSFISTASFIFLTLISNLKNKEIKNYLWIVPGYFLAILPFILFDLTHPPGLFITRFILFQQENIDKNFIVFLSDFIKNLWIVIHHYAVNNISGSILFIYLGSLIIYDFKKSRIYLIYIFVWLFQIFGVTLIKASFTHYFLPGLIFFLIYLYLPRKFKKINLVVVSTLLLLNGSLFSIIPQITTQKYVPEMWQPNIETVDNITNVLYQEIKNNNLSGVNLAVLGSPDPNRYGWKYRSLLEMKNIHIMSKYEYFTNNYLFVVSQQSEEKLRNDLSPEMERFRNQKLLKSWEIKNSNWFIYLFSF